MSDSAVLIDNPNAGVPADPAALAEAFRLFCAASNELSRSYEELQAQVAQLTGELAQANGELRRQYQEKAALNERLGMLLAALPAGVVVLDGVGLVVEANPAAQQVMGADCAGQLWRELRAAHLAPTDSAREWTRADGMRVDMHETPLDSAGGCIVLLHDVSEAHRMRAQAARNERLAAMGEMVAGLAHQLRTPLSAALLYAANLQSPALPDAERTRASHRVVERLQHLETLIRDMLVFARGEIGARELLHVTDLVEEIAAICEPVARARGVEFVVLAEAASATLWVSRADLVGALTNLIDNAIVAAANAAADAGRGVVQLDVVADMTQVTFSVSDNGPGIPPALQKRLFEPFFTTRAQGTGLGLAIARGVARAHGGDIEAVAGRAAAADARWGCEFRLWLPIAAKSAAKSAAESIREKHE